MEIARTTELHARERGADVRSGQRTDAGRESVYQDLCGNKRIWVSIQEGRKAGGRTAALQDHRHRHNSFVSPISIGEPSLCWNEEEFA